MRLASASWRSLSLLALLLLLPTTARAADLSGDGWSGKWYDFNTGHCGPLWATFCKCDDGHYRVTFSGRFRKVIPFRYTVVLTVTRQEGDKVFLEGESRVPLFGTFRYSGEATSCDFRAEFCSRRYVGEFVLSR